MTRQQWVATRFRRTLLMGMCVLLGLAVAAPAAANRSTETRRGAPAREAPVAEVTTALAVTAQAAPLRVTGSDGQEHLEYDLLMTNRAPVDVTLTSVDVLTTEGDVLLQLAGDGLAAVTHLVSGAPPTTTIPPSATVATVLDVVVAADAVPASLTHRITYELPADTDPVIVALFATPREISGPALQVDRRKPIVIAAPLPGAGWWNANGCCDYTPHREFLLPANGEWVKPETFAIDWVQLRNGRLFEEDGTALSQYPYYGTSVVAVANGTVVSVVDGLPEIAPGAEPILTKPEDFAGNHVVLRIRPGVYALFAHLQPGSIRVDVGDRVRTGDHLGALGNSGNTTLPHLHFGLMDGPAPLSSNSLPFEIDRFTLEGIAGEGDEPGEFPVTGPPREVRRVHPLFLTVADFG